MYLCSLSSMFSLCYTSSYIRYGRQCFCEYKSGVQAIEAIEPRLPSKSLSHLGQGRDAETRSAT